jgi:hypothetical protein
MKKMLFSLLAIAGTTMLMAQLPPPGPSPAAAATTVTGALAQFNYGPNGRIEGFLIAPTTLISLPPDLAIQVELLAKMGDPVTASGLVASATSGMQIMQPQTITVAGRTLQLGEPSPPAPYAGAGVIRSLNYGREGEINGFVLQNGIIALTPRMGVNEFSVVKPGASIAVSGFARSTAGGRTVVEVQSITANGQTIALNASPPGGPDRLGPERGPESDRGPRGAAPPPPPPPGAPAPPPPPLDR